MRGYEAFAKGDIETLKTLFSAGANWNAIVTGVCGAMRRHGMAARVELGDNCDVIQILG
jgi:hypothetical protein